MWDFPTQLKRRFGACVGQAMAEYVIATAGAVLMSLFVLQLFEQWLAWYYYDMTALVCLPIP